MLRQSVKKTFGVSALLILLATIGIFSWAYTSTNTFVESYEVYAKLSLSEENAIYLPAQPNNPVRQELNRILSDVLGAKISSSERSAKARRGIALVQEANHELDPIQDRGGAIDEAIAAMERATSLVSRLSSSGVEQSVVARAKRRADIVSEIRALSVRANFETQKIFEHIVQDRGALTGEYIVELNTKIPEAEERFNRRSRLYGELQDVSDSIVRDYVSLSVFGFHISGK